MTRAEEFDKAWRLGFKGDFSLFDEIYHPDFKGVAPAADEVELNFDGFKEVLHTLKDFIVFTPPKTLAEEDTFLKVHRYNKLKEADVFSLVTVFLTYKDRRIINQEYLAQRKNVDADILMIHGDADEIVTPNFLLEAKDFFIRNAVNIETRLIKNCGHHIPVEASSIGLNYILEKFNNR